jgi:hypothetical protein
MRTETKISQWAKRGVLIAIVGILLIGCGLIIAFNVAHTITSSSLVTTVFLLSVYPFLFLWIYLAYHMLYPLIKKREIEGIRQWILEFFFGLAIIFCLIVLDLALLEFAPTMPIEDRGLLSLLVLAFSMIAISVASRRIKRH